MAGMQGYWTSTAAGSATYPALTENLEVEVAILGAGIVGLTAAELLARAGKRVAVLEARRVGRQVTGNSTAKVTSQHGLVYRQLADAFGEEAARSYGAANQAAVERIAELVAELGIDCRFERKPAFVYSRSEEALSTLEDEAGTAARLGLPASFVAEPPLPFPTVGAVRFDGQAQFDPCGYLLGLAASVAARGRLFEETRATSVEEGSPCVVHTEQGATVTAGHVIVATHLPTIPEGKLFAKAYPFAHPMAAAPVDPARAPEGMFISSDEPRHSFRVDRRDGETWLVATGGTFKPGHAEEAAAMAEDLERFVSETFGIAEIPYRWTNEDFVSMDGLPLIGPPAEGHERLLVATGFNAWGITNGTVAGMILSDRLLGRVNPWAGLFDATRPKAKRGVGSFLKENVEVAKHFAEGRLVKRRPHDVELAAGEAAVIEGHEGQLALFRDDGGRLHSVSAVCSHLGCVVGWNPVDRTWDCPCHGSRFLPDGSVLNGPAVSPLPAVDPEGDS